MKEINVVDEKYFKYITNLFKNVSSFYKDLNRMYDYNKIRKELLAFSPDISEKEAEEIYAVASTIVLINGINLRISSLYDEIDKDNELAFSNCFKKLRQNVNLPTTKTKGNQEIEFKDNDILNSIRNGLSHAGYVLFIDEDNPSIDSIKIQIKNLPGCEFSVKDLCYFFDTINELAKFTCASKEDKVSAYSIQKTNTKNYNRKTLKKDLENIVITEIRAEKGEETGIYATAELEEDLKNNTDLKRGILSTIKEFEKNKKSNIFRLRKCKIGDESKEVLETIISSYGFNTISSLSRDEFAQLIKSTIENFYYGKGVCGALEVMSPFLVEEINLTEDFNNYMMLIEGMFSYPKAVLLRAYFDLNYINELNNKMSGKIVDFANVNRKAFNDVVLGTTRREYEGKTIDMQNPRQNKYLPEYFFYRIRDCLTHSYSKISINYTEYLKTGKKEKIEIIFNEPSIVEGNDEPLFNAKIKLGDLEKVMDNIEKQITSKQERQEENDEFVK